MVFIHELVHVYCRADFFIYCIKRIRSDLRLQITPYLYLLFLCSDFLLRLEQFVLVGVFRLSFRPKYIVGVNRCTIYLP